jgi:hypothetical protein
MPEDKRERRSDRLNVVTLEDFTPYGADTEIVRIAVIQGIIANLLRTSISHNETATERSFDRAVAPLLTIQAFKSVATLCGVV